jgi:broad specificity phosphatase PhoE
VTAEPNPTWIYLIRHGETEWNREEVFRGRKDIPLSDRGREQARLLASRLRDTLLAAVYSSPLQRASETARIVAACQAVDPADGLTDMSFGEWEGLPLSEVEARWPDLHALWQTRPESFTAPGGENLEAVRSRALPALETIAQTHPDAAVAVVSHRVVNKVLLCAALGLDQSQFWRIRQDTCCLNIIERAPHGWILRLLNDTCHLGRSAGDRRDF